MFRNGRCSRLVDGLSSRQAKASGCEVGLSKIRFANQKLSRPTQCSAGRARLRLARRRLAPGPPSALACRTQRRTESGEMSKSAAISADRQVIATGRRDHVTRELRRERGRLEPQADPRLDTLSSSLGGAKAPLNGGSNVTQLRVPTISAGGVRSQRVVNIHPRTERSLKRHHATDLMTPLAASAYVQVPRRAAHLSSSSREAQRAGIAVVQQEFSSVPSLTAAESLIAGEGSIKK